MLFNLLNDYTFRIVAMGGILLGVLSGISGTFAVLRKQSLIGDSIAHASLAGIALAFMITQSKHTEVLLLGALIIGLICTAIINFFAHNSKVNIESAMALVMSTFFGIGLMLLTQIQKMPNSNQAGLNRFLFGQAATILQRDVILTLIVLIIVAVLMVLFWKELKVFTFDPVFSHTIGFKGVLLNILVSSFTVASVIMGIQMVGVVLMSALLIAPAVAARQWTQSLKSMTLLAGFIGGVSGFFGTMISSTVPKFPAGPAIVLIVSFIVIVSILFAPRRGIVYRKSMQKSAQRDFAADMLLIHFYTHHKYELDDEFHMERLYEANNDIYTLSKKRFHRLYKNLEHRDMITSKKESFRLTDDGLVFIQEKGGTV